MQVLRLSPWWRFKSSSEWRWRQDGPMKCWYLTTTLHSITNQKTMIWKEKGWRVILQM